MECRAASVDTMPMNEACKVVMELAVNIWPGWVMIRDQNPDDADHGWLEVQLVDPSDHGAASSFARSIIRGDGFAVWKHTGAIYRYGLDYAVEDDPISTSEFLTILVGGEL
jgi:hypothetical protein